jgi:23S rRNA (cytidine1920-2'-O)/16S rRNA (cytidine1409-2'-O)-methyltransferase
MLKRPMAKRRLEMLLLERGLADSREDARIRVMAGSVLVNDHVAVQPGGLVDEDARLSLVERPRYVSRGGDKLEHALRKFAIKVEGAVAIDVGASTGGFTDCLLQHGAARVYAVDVGRGQLDYRLRNDARVVVMEGVNARDLESLPQPVDIAVIDVAFISLRQVLPAVRRLLAPAAEAGLAGTKARPTGGTLRLTETKARLKPGLPEEGDRGAGSILALFKPQFEAAKAEVQRGGVIRDPQMHAKLIGRFAAWCAAEGLRILGLTASPLLGPAGNREFFFHLRGASS